MLIAVDNDKKETNYEERSAHTITDRIEPFISN